MGVANTSYTNFKPYIVPTMLQITLYGINPQKARCEKSIVSMPTPTAVLTIKRNQIYRPENRTFNCASNIELTNSPHK